MTAGDSATWKMRSRDHPKKLAALFFSMGKVMRLAVGEGSGTFTAPSDGTLVLVADNTASWRATMHQHLAISPKVGCCEASEAVTENCLDGSWSSWNAPMRLKSIEGGTLKWDNGDVTNLRFLKPKKFEIMLGGKSFIGDLQDYGNILWDDGDVWVRRKVNSVGVWSYESDCSTELNSDTQSSSESDSDTHLQERFDPVVHLETTHLYAY